MGVAIWGQIPRRTIDLEDLAGQAIALDAFNTIIELEDVLNTLQLTREQLVLVGLLTGTDYNEGVALEREEIEEAPEARVPREDLDLVCVYLKHIARRKLLRRARSRRSAVRWRSRAATTRGELLAELAMIPAARQTLLSLAGAVRRRAVPAAELILLPDGGELEPEKTDPVLRAFARVRRLESQIDAYRERIANRRTTAASRARFRAEIECLVEAMRAILRDLPVRPSVVDDAGA